MLSEQDFEIDSNMYYLNDRYFWPNTTECNGENDCGCPQCEMVARCDGLSDLENNGGCMPWE